MNLMLLIMWVEIVKLGGNEVKIELELGWYWWDVKKIAIMRVETSLDLGIGIGVTGFEKTGLEDTRERKK